MKRNTIYSVLFIVYFTFFVHSVLAQSSLQTVSTPTNANKRTSSLLNAVLSSQDFNTTRSNKDKAAISTAQDFNSSRSNRERGQLDVNSDTGTDISHTQSSAISTAQDFNATRSNRDKSGISTAQDFNTTRSNKERGQLDVNSDTGTDVSHVQSSAISTAQDFNATRSNRDKSGISTAQDFNTTRSNKERGQLDVNSDTGTDVSHVQSSAVSTAQDFNSSRSNRERRLSVSDTESHLEMSVSPSMLFPLNKNQHAASGMFNGNAFGTAIDVRYYWNKIGLGLSNGFISSKVNSNAVNNQLTALGVDSETASISSTDGNQTFFTLGPLFQWGNKFKITASVQGGLFINNPSNIVASGKDGVRAVLKVADNNKKYQAGLVGDISLSYPITKTLMLGLGTAYHHTNSSVLYSDLKQQTAVVKQTALQNIGAHVSFIVRIPTTNAKQSEPLYSATQDVSCGPASIKETLPDGSVRDYTFACPQDAATYMKQMQNEKLANDKSKPAVLGSLTLNMDKHSQSFTQQWQNIEPNLKASGVKVTRQTQGATFGEKVSTGLATASLFIKDNRGSYTFDDGAALKSGNNPLYTGSGSAGDNPLHTKDRLIATLINQQTGVEVSASEFTSDVSSVTFDDLLPGNYEIALTGVLNFENIYDVKSGANDVAGIVSLSGYANVALTESKTKKHIGAVKYENFSVVDVDNDAVNELGVGEKISKNTATVTLGNSMSGAEITLLEKANQKIVKTTVSDGNGVFQLSIPNEKKYTLRVNIPVVVADVLRFTVDRTGRIMFNR